MTHNLKPYPAYKPSGVEWLGDVPAHWEVRRARNIVDMRVSNVDKHTKRNELPVQLCNYVDVYKNNKITEQISFMQATASAEEIERFRIEKGDVLLTKDSEVWNDIGVPALVEYAAKDIVCGYHLALLRPRKVLLEGDYLFRALQCPPIAHQFHVAANGVTRYGLSQGAIKSILLPIPPLPEQAAIATFLDHKTAEIDEAISKKQRLIDLLKEQKAILIDQAVTKGLNPNVPMRDSGVEWIGEVPAHWEVKRVKWVTRLQRGYDLPAEQRIPGPFPVVSSGGIIGTHCKARSNGPGVVMGRYGSTEAVFFVEPDFWPHNTALFVTDFQANRPRWCYFMLQTISKADHSDKSAVPGINRKDIFEIKVAVPPVTEQDTIIQQIENASARLEAAVSSVHRQISLLQEYRAILIADVVTGKLDVREDAPHES